MYTTVASSHTCIEWLGKLNQMRLIGTLAHYSVPVNLALTHTCTEWWQLLGHLGTTWDPTLVMGH